MSVPEKGSKRSYVSIQGAPINWAWSLKEYRSDNVGVSARNQKPPPGIPKKSPDQILWAFRQRSDYIRLQEIVSRSSYANVVLITTQEGTGGGFSGGVMGFGEIRREDLIGTIKWEYWPRGSDWDYKFFIRITRLCPEVQTSLERLKKWSSLGESGIISIIKTWSDSIIHLVPKSLTQGSLAEIDERTYRQISIIANVEWKFEEKPGASKDEYEPNRDLKKIVISHLVAGKNVIIYGPPGVGKTTFAKKVCEDMASGYGFAVGNPEWTVFDVVGGKSLTGEYCFGFLTEATVKCWDALAKGNRPYWLILDEINRANVDLAFGNAFTIMDAPHRGAVPLLELKPADRERLQSSVAAYFEDYKLFMPYSFRIVSTMNSYDRALLFKMGFALIRRFALIPMSLKPYTLKEVNDEFTQGARALIGETTDEHSRLYEDAKRELLLNRDNPKDFLVLDGNFFVKLSSGLVDDYFSGTSSTMGFSPFDLIEAICRKINQETDGRVEIGRALSLDASKFLIASYFVFEDNASRVVRSLVDEAVAAYIIPQLDILSESIRAEKMGLYTETRVSGKIKSLIDSFSHMGLSLRTVPMLERIQAGERVF